VSIALTHMLQHSVVVSSGNTGYFSKVKSLIFYKTAFPISPFYISHTTFLFAEELLDQVHGEVWAGAIVVQMPDTV
jgi:hypothetical protein